MTRRENSTSLGLLQGARDDDTQAWERLRDLYAPLVAHWCRKSGFFPPDGDDISQDVFAAVAKGLKTYRGEAKFRTWLRTITINKIRDFARSSRLRPSAVGGSTMAEYLEQVAFPTNEAELEQEEHDILLGQVLKAQRENVSPTTWQAFWRTTIDNAPTSIVADELGISEGAVRQAKYRLLQRIKQELTDLELQAGGDSK